MEQTKVHPVTGEALRRGVRTETVSYGDRSEILQVPGWYPEGAGDGVHTGADLAEENPTWKRLKDATRND